MTVPPSTGELLRCIADHPGVVECGGMLYSPAREDEGVLVNSLRIYAQSAVITASKLGYLLAAFGLYRTPERIADPIEIETARSPWRPAEEACCLRWE